MKPGELFGLEMLADPYPVYGELRAEDPVHWEEPLHSWVVTRYDDIVACLHDPRLETRIAFEGLLPMLPRLQLIPGALSYQPSFNPRGLRSLPVCLGPSIYRKALQPSPRSQTLFGNGHRETPFRVWETFHDPHPLPDLRRSLPPFPDLHDCRLGPRLIGQMFEEDPADLLHRFAVLVDGEMIGRHHQL
jgi:hypothetical protein